MISRYEVTLNGVPLSEVSEKILITNVQHNDLQIANEGQKVAKRQGARLYSRDVNSASVTVTFQIRAYSITERQAIRDDIVAWAKEGGILTTNDREGRRLRCVCENYPVIDSVRDWLKELQMTFSAYELPFWEDEEQTVLNMSGRSGQRAFYVPGNVPSNIDRAYVEVDITANESLTSISLAVAGDTALVLTGISVPANGVVRIAYDNNIIQSIKYGNTSLLNKRTGADDLKAICGTNNSFSFTANANVNVAFKMRGLWL